MRRIFSAALVVVIALALIAPAVTAHGGRPFWGWSSGVTTFYDNDLDCEAEVTTKVDLPAFASHLGRSQLVTSHCPGEGVITDGDLTLVAKNGDELHGTYFGEVTASADFTVFFATIHITFDGAGTGRFDDAEGQATMYAVARAADGPEWPWHAVWLGWLSY